MFHMPMITKSRSPSGTEGRVVLMCGVVGVEGGSKGRGDAAFEIVNRNEAFNILIMYIHSKVALSLSQSTCTGLN